jgi:hypothetical protein
MPVIPVNKMVDTKRIIGKRGLWRRRGTGGKKDACWGRHVVQGYEA